MMRIIHVARAVLRQPSIRVVVAGAALQFGLNALVNIVTELRDEVTALRSELDNLRAQVPEPRQPEVYPAGSDLDPLDRAQLDEVEKRATDAASWQPFEAPGSDHPDVNP